MRVYLKTLGCRLNQAEMDRMARQLVRLGHEVVDSPADAELVVVNTCAVTQEATRSSRQAVYQLGRENPDAAITVTGCYAHLEPDEAAALPGVVHIVDNLHKDDLVPELIGASPETLAALERFDLEPIQRELQPGIGGRTRAFVKVQDGCDRHCTFCVTRIARGPGRSRPLADVVAEVQALGAAGYQEAVLTGVHLGSYGWERGEPDGLMRLLRALLADTDMPRLRLSSLEPWGIPPGFFRLWDNPRLGRHLHLPLQSGCDATLRRMVRRTSQAEFRALVAEARAHIPDVAIATDLIIGFPGETDEEFAISRDFVDEMRFAGVHAFRFSARPGTAAARMGGQVDEATKKRRLDAIQAIALMHERGFAAAFVGTVRPVLWEGIQAATDAGFVHHGYTDNYLRVRHVARAALTNRITPARLGSLLPDAPGVVLTGEPV